MKTPAKILCYRRPWLKRHMPRLLGKAFPGAQVRYICDFLGLEGEELQRGITTRMQAPEPAGPHPLGPDEFHEVRARCRLLRLIDEQTAGRLCRAAWETIAEILNQFQPELVVAKPVDSYVLDILARLCRRRGIPYFSTVAAFINGYQRYTIYGEHHHIREVDDQEAAQALERLLQQDYLPDFLDFKPSAGKTALKSWRNQARKLARLAYNWYRQHARDPYNYHYWSSWKVEAQRIDWLPHAYLGHSDWRQHLQNLGARPKVFLPLQFIPEATVDYYCPNLEVVDYQKTLLQVLDTFAAQGVTVVAKEHPGVVGMRRWCEYQAIARHPNVVMVPPYVRASHLVQLSEMVFVWTGTVGFEAALRGKPVIHIGNPYYVQGRYFFAADPWHDLERVIQKVLATELPPIGRLEQVAMVRHYLATCLPGFCREVDPPAEEEAKTGYRQELEAAAKALRQGVNAIFTPRRDAA